MRKKRCVDHHRTLHSPRTSSKSKIKIIIEWNFTSRTSSPWDLLPKKTWGSKKYYGRGKKLKLIQPEPHTHTSHYRQLAIFFPFLYLTTFSWSAQLSPHPKAGQAVAHSIFGTDANSERLEFIERPPTCPTFPTFHGPISKMLVVSQAKVNEHILCYEPIKNCQ